MTDRPDAADASSGDAQSADARAAALPRSPGVPERPPLPRPERLNRNVLTIAAVVMGTLVLAAVVLVQPNRPGSPRVAPATAPEPPQGTFLDQPARASGRESAPHAGLPAGNRDASAARASSDSGGTRRGAAVAAAYGSYGGYAGYAPPVVAPASPAVDRRTAAYRAALEAPVVASAVVSTTGAAEWEGEPSQIPGRVPGQAAGSVVGLSLTSPAVPSGGAGSGHGQFLADVARPAPTTVRTAVLPVPGPYAIQAGTMIPVVLVTEINSDLPGEVLAQVARDVYDSRTLEALLIPKGSKLIGRYEDQVGVGQDRLLVAWTRVIFPDGRSVALPGLQTKDRAGAGGLGDQVDHHGRRVFGTAALLSLISAGAQLSQPNGGYGAFGSYPSPGQIAAGAAGQELAQVAAQMLRRDMDVRPTIRIRQGMPFNVFLNADLTFAAPYAGS